MKTKNSYDTTKTETQQKITTIPLGRVMVTSGLQDAIECEEFLEALERHRHRDWGEVGTEDWEANQQALLHGRRLFSVYDSPSTGARFWIITEADRSSTTGLLPSEY